MNLSLYYIDFDCSDSNAMTIDTRIHEILKEYERDWDDLLIPILTESFPQ